MLPMGKLREDCPLGIVTPLDELSIVHAISYHTGLTRPFLRHPFDKAPSSAICWSYAVPLNMGRAKATANWTINYDFDYLIAYLDWFEYST